MSDLAPIIDGAIIRVLLRYFRRGSRVVLPPGVRTAREDAGLVMMHWAMSAEIERLATRLAMSPHEADLVLAQERSESDGIARGRIDARSTLLVQLRSGDHGRTVSFAPSRHADHGANRLIVWVLKRASQLLDQIEGLMEDGSPYLERCAAIRSSIARASRFSRVSELFRTLRLSDRPCAGDVRHAATHRKGTYRLGAAAYLRLTAIERGDESAVAATLHESVIAPLEPWRRFELLTALAVAEELARASTEPLTLEILGSGGASRPLARCRPYEVFWQARTSYYTEPAPEPSEQIAAGICEDFGISCGADRPDVVVVDAVARRVVSIAEAKFIGGTAGYESGPFTDAVLQLVRYARGYDPGVLARSLIAMSRLPVQVCVGSPSGRSPFAIDLDGLLSGELARWNPLDRPLIDLPDAQ